LYETGGALVIDLKKELQYYNKIDLDKLEDEGRDFPDNIKNSIVLYNKALESLQTGSEDIASIELKKAISLNPDFYEAVNLLGVCYSYLNEQEKAIEMFQRVVNAENNGVKALSYIGQINAGEDEAAASFTDKKKKSRKTRESKKPNQTNQMFNRKEHSKKAASLSQSSK
jgi:tetratricopeptide (TPR) repeat protein